METEREEWSDFKGKIILEAEEKDAEPLTSPVSIKPQKKKTEEKMFGSRILIISPYGPLNMFLESKLTDLILGAKIDIIKEADYAHVPYIRVKEREKTTQKPYCIIDFQSIIARVEKDHYDESLRIPARRNALLNIFKDYVDKIPDGIITADIQNPDQLRSKIKELAGGLEKTLEERLRAAFEQIGDFTKIVKNVQDVVDFIEYEAWATDRNIPYLKPYDSFKNQLRERHQYDQDGNFISNSTYPTAPYHNDIMRDLEKFFRTKKGILPQLFGRGLKLFEVRAA